MPHSSNIERFIINVAYFPISYGPYDNANMIWPIYYGLFVSQKSETLKKL